MVVAAAAIVLILVAFLLSCSKPAAVTSQPVTNVVEDVQPEAVASTNKKTMVAGQPSHRAEFASTPLSTTFWTEWSVFTNHWHPNGAVIVESFGVAGGTVYRLGQVSPGAYLEGLHQGLRWAPSGESHAVPGQVRDWFRTAEALIAAAYAAGGPQTPAATVVESVVAEHGRLMFGRQSGVQAAYPLR
jgi:hypothetical protein